MGEHSTRSAIFIAQLHCSTFYSTKLVVKVYWIPTGFFEKDENRVDVQKTHKTCEEDKQIIEQLNGVKYRFGKATMYDSYNKKAYIELIKE